jgi:hypothetical protein
MNEGNVIEPLDGKEDSGKDNSDCVSKELDYGSEDLTNFGKKKGLPCVPIKRMTHGVKGIVECLDFEEHGNNLQVVEVKRPRPRGHTCKNLRRAPKSKRKIVVESLETDTSNTLPCASKGLESTSQTYKKEPYYNVDASPLGNEGDQGDEHIECSIDIIVIDSHEPIVVGGLGTQLEDDIDALTQVQPHPHIKGKANSRHGENKKANAIALVAQLVQMNTTWVRTFKLEFKPKYSMHATPCKVEGGGKKRKNETLMLEFGKQLLAKKMSTRPN